MTGSDTDKNAHVLAKPSVLVNDIVIYLWTWIVRAKAAVFESHTSRTFVVGDGNPDGREVGRRCACCSPH